MKKNGKMERFEEERDEIVTTDNCSDIGMALVVIWTKEMQVNMMSFHS